MKKIQVLSLSLLLLVFANANAAMDTTLDTIGDSFTVSDSDIAFGTIGNVGSFTVSNDGGSGFNLNFSGTLTHLAGDYLLLTNIATSKVVQEFLIGPTFNTTNFYDNGVYSMIINGVSTGNAAYELTVSAVPIPAAALLFGSAFLGFVGFSARRKSTTKVTDPAIA